MMHLLNLFKIYKLQINLLFSQKIVYLIKFFFGDISWKACESMTTFSPSRAIFWKLRRLFSFLLKSSGKRKLCYFLSVCGCVRLWKCQEEKSNKIKRSSNSIFSIHTLHVSWKMYEFCLSRARYSPSWTENVCRSFVILMGLLISNSIFSFNEIFFYSLWFIFVINLFIYSIEYIRKNR